MARVEDAGLGAALRVAARMRQGYLRALAGGHRFDARGEMLNHLVPLLARAMAVAHAMGRRRSRLMAEDVQLDRFSEVMREVRDAGVGVDLTRLQRGYAKRLYDSMRHMGSNVDAKTRAFIASLISDKVPKTKALEILTSKLGALDHHIETIYRTEMSAAYYAGRWQEDQGDPRVWGYRYVQIDRPTKRDEHVPLHGTTLPKRALFWRRYWPPNGWNCGCTVVTLYKKHKERLPGKINGKVPPPDDGFRQNFADLGTVEFSWESQERVPGGHSGGGQWTSEEAWPPISKMTYVKDLGGTTGAKLYEHNGKKYVVKKGASPEHAKNEYEANLLYSKMNVPVPESQLQDGVLITKFIEGKQFNQLTPAEQELARELLKKNFAKDALLGNWDVTGANGDNIIVDKKGVPWRIDNGGALAFRAQGGSKGAKWNGEVSELKTMREMNPAASVFGGLSDEDVKKQVNHVVNLKLSTSDPILKERLVKLAGMSDGTQKWPWGGDVTVPKAVNAGYDAYKQTYNKLAPGLKKAGLDEFKVDKAALANSIKPSETKILIDKQWSKYQTKVEEQFPGKIVEQKALGPMIKKHLGATTQEAKKKGIESIFSVTKEEKAIAVGMAKTAKQKAAAEALNVVEAKPATFLPTTGNKYWDSRKKIENGSTIENKTYAGNLSSYKWDSKLPSQEYDAISTWKGSAFAIRESIWTNNPSETAKHFESAIQKAPTYEGILHRGVGHVTPGTKFYEALKTPGNVIELEAPMGCSRESGRSVSFSNGVCVVRVAAKNGKSIETIASHEHEKETIMPRGTKLKVIGVAHNIQVENVSGKKKSIALFVDVEEVDENPHHKIALSLPVHK